MKIVIPKLHPETEKAQVPTLTVKPKKIETEPPKSQAVDYKNIVKENPNQTYAKPVQRKPEIRENDPNFVDDQDVPPLC